MYIYSIRSYLHPTPYMCYSYRKCGGIFSIVCVMPIGTVNNSDALPMVRCHISELVKQKYNMAAMITWMGILS